jgi:hypothetical protein
MLRQGVSAASSDVASHPARFVMLSAKLSGAHFNIVFSLVFPMRNMAGLADFVLYLAEKDVTSSRLDALMTPHCSDP